MSESKKYLSKKFQISVEDRLEIFANLIVDRLIEEYKENGLSFKDKQ